MNKATITIIEESEQNPYATNPYLTQDNTPNFSKLLDVDWMVVSHKIGLIMEWIQKNEATTLVTMHKKYNI